MENNTGWVKLYRKIFSNPFMGKPAYLSVWVWILTHAEHGKKFNGKQWVNKEEEEMPSIIWKGERIHLKKGEFTFGEYRIAKETGVNRGNIHRILNIFKNEHQVELQRGNKFSLGKVNNWDIYQSIEYQDEHQVNIKRTSSEHVTKNDKNVKNILVNTNNAKAKGDIFVNKVIDNFFKRQGFNPTDKKPRFEAYNLVRQVKKFLKDAGKEETEEKIIKIIDKYYEWLDKQDWFHNAETMGVVRRKFEIYRQGFIKYLKTNVS